MATTCLQNRTKFSAPSATGFNGLALQRKCACGGSAGVRGECDSCEHKKLSLQRSSLNSGFATQKSDGVSAIVHEVLRSSGQPLDAETRAFMEPRLGHDFSRVRVHTDQHAAESARAVSAQAYTLGSDVVFGAGQYKPETDTGKRLIAHELTHVEQQKNVWGFQGALELGSTHDLHEDEADRVAASVMHPSTIAANLLIHNLQTVPAHLMRTSQFVPPDYPIPKPKPCKEACFDGASSVDECEECCFEHCCSDYPEDKKDFCKLDCIETCIKPAPE